MQVPSIVSHLKYGRQAGQPQLKAFLPRVGTTRKKNPKLITMLFLMMGGIFCRTEFRSLLTICSAESGKTQELMLYCLYNKIKPQNPWMILLYVSVAYQHAYNFYVVLLSLGSHCFPDFVQKTSQGITRLLLSLL